MTFDTIIFDMDGVLVNSEALWKAEDGSMISQLFPAEEVQAIRAAVTGVGLRGNYEILKQNGKIDISFAEFVTERKAFALQNVYPRTSLIEGVLPFLQLAASKFVIGLGSSSPREFIRCVFEHHPIEQYFTAVVSSDDVDGKEKPAPDIFLRVAELLQIPPQKCLVIEDSKNGVLAGKAAGMTVWGYQYDDNQNQDLSAADKIFTDFTKLTL